jgi:hypothetical protein
MLTDDSTYERRLDQGQVTIGVVSNLAAAELSRKTDFHLYLVT